MEIVFPASGSATNRPDDQASPRFTWYAVGLVVYFCLTAMLWHHGVPRHQRPFSLEGKLLGIIFEWAEFLVAYLGIRASGVSFADAVGRPSSSLPEVRKDLASAVIVVLLIYLNDHLLMHLGPFRPSSMGHATTGYQYVATVLGAVTAGFTEEVIFRGLMLTQFRILTGNIIAAGVIQSLVFALAHGGNQSPTQFLKHCCSGWLFAYLAITRKSLWPAIFAHVLFDVLIYTVQFLAR